MLGPSWACWHLVFGWALLLGQLARGAEGCREEGCAYERQPVEERCCNEEPPPSEERGEADSWGYGSEFLANLQRTQLEAAAAYEASVIPDHLKRIAVSHYNDHSRGPYYRHLEDTQIKVKKAIGTMAYLHLFFEKTWCVKDGQRDRFITYTNEYLDSLACSLPPEMDRTKLDCTFGIFIDARSGRQAVVSHQCTTVRNPEESLLEDLK